ncbi:unnamed protein product [Rotaria magnacalcarata]|uniref:Uncharacterized protein n=2 Tax=Rotaria magnacalcarata TaxID=392030 RepID=A0A819PA14_9BILA|nr:unnamed protein product [Rotaria magnacalcarata]CAF3951440.1 unnamed protein product [Rotaria magnacalcarata]CAF4010374.1 unnamed protein product [Rotaria magnacalcarata]CAF4133877.1 unnamed protein product [Rotaria magnacalcarata]
MQRKPSILRKGSYQIFHSTKRIKEDGDNNEGRNNNSTIDQNIDKIHMRTNKIEENFSEVTNQDQPVFINTPPDMRKRFRQRQKRSCITSGIALLTSSIIITIIVYVGYANIYSIELKTKIDIINSAKLLYSFQQWYTSIF